MDTPQEQPNLPALPETAAPNTGDVTAAIHSLLEHDQLLDANDRKRVTEALAFLSSPSKEIAETKQHASSIGEVMGGYYMQGNEPPQEIETLNKQLQLRMCQQYIDIAQATLAQQEPDLPTIRHAITFAWDISKSYAKAYGDATHMKQVTELADTFAQKNPTESPVELPKRPEDQ